MKKFYLGLIVWLSLSSTLIAKQYELELPSTLPIKDIDNWVLNIAIADQVCTPFPDFCLSAIMHTNSIVSSGNAYDLYIKDGVVHIRKQISVESINISELETHYINVSILKMQLSQLDLPSRQADLVQGYITESL
ncbi:hypothetical protein IB292_01825 [Vibrio parahaemolyticus]|uniref:Uncharacterized protein n=1 Tax=Vibrio parahaemolyticus TaxID=670 RepID=A0A9Q3U9P8_VIBPH|nr:hypothetical protein [Vibrio parahaemolyticus]MCC3803765.1 hypothetical protein [Vibrio parahaemolyticus]